MSKSKDCEKIVSEFLEEFESRPNSGVESLTGKLVPLSEFDCVVEELITNLRNRGFDIGDIKPGDIQAIKHFFSDSAPLLIQIGYFENGDISPYKAVLFINTNENGITTDLDFVRTTDISEKYRAYGQVIFNEFWNSNIIEEEGEEVLDRNIRFFLPKEFIGFFQTDFERKFDSKDTDWDCDTSAFDAAKSNSQSSRFYFNMTLMRSSENVVAPYIEKEE